MRTLTTHEKRTIRIATIGIAIYLALFGGWHAWAFLTQERTEYQKLRGEAEKLRQDLQPYADRIQVAKKLMQEFHLDPAKFSAMPKASVMAEVNAAIQKAALGSGIQIGPVREDPARASARELATVRFEGTGPVPAVMGLLNRLESLGYPLVIDVVQVTPEPTKPGQAKLNLTIVILDFEQWKSEVMPHA